MSAKRVWLITDTHFGIRNNSLEWLEIQKNYFHRFFIPLLKEKSKAGDVLLHCGDVFDSRSSLNLLVMNEALEIFEEISRIMPIHIILGNHDIYKKNTNDVHSVKIMKWIPNINIYEEPTVLDFSGKKLLLMPWRNSKEEEAKCIKENPADFLFCHTDVAGLKFNKHTTIEEGLELSTMKSFRKVYAGHIHYSQHKGNFRMLGSPYQMTRSDMNNEKGIWMLDLSTEKEDYYPNNFSPQFMRYRFEGLLEMEMEDIKESFKNNFVDVSLDATKWSMHFPFSAFTEEVQGFRKLEFQPRMFDNEDDLPDGEITDEQIDILQLAQKLIMSTAHSDAVKDRMIQTVKNLYEKVQKEEAEQND